MSTTKQLHAQMKREIAADRKDKEKLKKKIQQLETEVQHLERVLIMVVKTHPCSQLVETEAGQSKRQLIDQCVFLAKIKTTNSMKSMHWSKRSCPVCDIPFDETDHVCLALDYCGHIMCSSCLKNGQKEGVEDIFCPKCGPDAEVEKILYLSS